MGRVEHKVSIVTGGTLGIGHACCFLLAKEGSKVAVTDLQDSQGREIAEAEWDR